MQNGRRFTGYGSGRNSETQCNSEYSASVHCSVHTSVNCSVVDMRLWGPHQRTQLNKTGRPRFGDSVDPNQGYLILAVQPVSGI
jgi:hypothetical protein